MNLKGGYKILSLVTLVLIASVDGTTATDITDVNTLEQLDSLKEFLDVSKQLKPILLRVKPSKEKVVMAELSRVDDVTFMIHAKLDGYELNIVVSFEQDEETLEYYIDEAGYLYIADVDKVAGEVAKAEDGTPVKMLGLDEDGGLVKGDLPASGTKLYKHVVDLGSGFSATFISTINKNLKTDNFIATECQQFIIGNFYNNVFNYFVNQIKWIYDAEVGKFICSKVARIRLETSGIVIDEFTPVSDTVTEL